jgi:hypothetical protein
MAYFQNIRSFFNAVARRCSHSRHTESSYRAQDEHADAHTNETSNFQQEHEDPDDDPYAALSEIAAPEPVERFSEAELARHPSLEQGYANSRGDYYGNLSEVAAPEPVERLTEDEIARHPSLEQRLSRISHH